MRNAVLLVVFTSGAACGDDLAPAGGAIEHLIECSGTPWHGWTGENISNTPSTISHDPILVITPSGAQHLAFSEPDDVQLTDQDIWTVSRREQEWDEAVALTHDMSIQNAYASMVSEGETLHLVWNGGPGRSDIYYATSAGGAWSEPVNLTMPYESGVRRNAYAPTLALNPASGELLLAYVSSTSPPSIRAATIGRGQLAAPPITVIPGESSCGGTDHTCGCNQPSVVFDRGGGVHVAADCGLPRRADIWTARRSAGTWSPALLMPGNDDHDDVRPRLFLGSLNAVHMMWTATQPCVVGECGRMLYSTLLGGTWTAPIDLSDADTPGDYTPDPVFGPDGTIVVAFHRFDADRFSDVFIMTSIDDGRHFTPACNLTRTADRSEWIPSSLQFDPTSGNPNLIWDELETDSEPLNADIIHVELHE